MIRRWRTVLLAALLGLATVLGTVAQAAPGKARRLVVEAGRFTVAADRAGGRAPEIARQLVAQDLLLSGWLTVPRAQLQQPVTLLYLHRTRGLDRKLPFRGDRIGHEVLVPTDLRLWAVVSEETGLEDLRPATIQIAEYGLFQIAGELPPWLRSGMYELMARLQVVEGQVWLTEPSFPALQAAGAVRAPLAEAAETGWSRYQSPRRWYTSILAVGYLFDEDPAALSRALADPTSFDLDEEVDHARFEAWVEAAVIPGDRPPQVLAQELPVAVESAELDDDRLAAMLVDLSLVHKRGPRAFRLSTGSLDPAAAEALSLRANAEALSCGALWESPVPEHRYLLGLCLAGRSPHAAEEVLRELFRAEAGIPRAALQAAAMALRSGDRDGSAAPLVEQALAVAPADADAQLLWSVLRARDGHCTGWEEAAPGRLTAPWDALPYALGPVEASRDAFVREVLECTSE